MSKHFTDRVDAEMSKKRLAKASDMKRMQNECEAALREAFGALKRTETIWMKAMKEWGTEGSFLSSLHRMQNECSQMIGRLGMADWSEGADE